MSLPSVTAPLTRIDLTQRLHEKGGDRATTKHDSRASDRFGTNAQVNRAGCRNQLDGTVVGIRLLGARLPKGQTASRPLDLDGT